MNLIKKIFTKKSIINDKKYEKSEWVYDAGNLPKWAKLPHKIPFSLLHHKNLLETYKIPIIFDNRYMRHHINVWIYSNNITDEYVEKYIDISNISHEFNTITFYNKNEALTFMEWWNNYISKFDNESYKTSYYPSMSKGKIEGWFTQISESNGKPLSLTNSYFGVDNYKEEYYRKLADWIWIINNVSNKVKSCFDGWLFDNEQDYLLFTLLQKN